MILKIFSQKTTLFKLRITINSPCTPPATPVSYSDDSGYDCK